MRDMLCLFLDSNSLHHFVTCSQLKAVCVCVLQRCAVWVSNSDVMKLCINGQSITIGAQGQKHHLCTCERSPTAIYDDGLTTAQTAQLDGSGCLVEPYFSQ